MFTVKKLNVHRKKVKCSQEKSKCSQQKSQMVTGKSLNVYLFFKLCSFADIEYLMVHFRMLLKYGCSGNGWLNNLYMIKEKWCPAFSKEYFSGGVLSSQRSESTNHSISHRLKATHGLSDFYNIFLDVISDWRSREKVKTSIV